MRFFPNVYPAISFPVHFPYSCPVPDNICYISCYATLKSWTQCSLNLYMQDLPPSLLYALASECIDPQPSSMGQRRVLRDSFLVGFYLNENEWRNNQSETEIIACNFFGSESVYLVFSLEHFCSVLCCSAVRWGVTQCVVCFSNWVSRWIWYAGDQRKNINLFVTEKRSVAFQSLILEQDD